MVAVVSAVVTIAIVATLGTIVKPITSTVIGIVIGLLASVPIVAHVMDVKKRLVFSRIAWMDRENGERYAGLLFRYSGRPAILEELVDTCMVMNWDDHIEVIQNKK